MNPLLGRGRLPQEIARYRVYLINDAFMDWKALHIVRRYGSKGGLDKAYLKAFEIGFIHILKRSLIIDFTGYMNNALK